MRQLLNAGRRLCCRFPEALLQLLARLAVAVVFFKSGYVKISDWPVTLELFAGDYRVPLLPPAVAAVIATTIELGGSTMLALGIAARFGAAACLGLIAVIQVVVYPENWPDHLVWGTLLLYVLTRGPGPISVDRFVARNWLD
jgi:putative oxidoreductase